VSTTKQKILQASLKLFNEKGVHSTTLRDVANAVGISIGNLAYHFKNTDYIIEELFKLMEAERGALLSTVQLIPSFENIHEQALPILKLSVKYKFVYVQSFDLLKDYPAIAKLHRQYIESNIGYMKAMLDYSVATGNMQTEPYAGFYMRLAENIWMVLYFWLSQEILRGNKKHDIEAARRAMWEMILPHLTEKGKSHIHPLLMLDPLDTVIAEKRKPSRTAKINTKS